VLHGPPQPLFDAVVEEREWFANEDGSLLGLIVRYLPHNEWATVVLVRNGEGLFVSSLAEIRRGTIEEARTHLLKRMRTQ
jgi:hypothetical protein